MADCLFPAGIANVSGTLSKTTIITSKGEVAARSSFALMASEVSRRMANGDKRPRKLIWAEVKAEFKKGDSHAEV